MVPNKVSAITYANSSVFVGGNFTTVNGTARKYIAALDPTTALLTSWDPGIIYSTDGSGINCVLVSPDGSMLFAGGGIDSVSGVPSQKALVQFSTSTGVIQNWSSGIGANYGNHVINTLFMDAGGQNLYAGGLFNAIGTEPRSSLSGFNFSSPLPVELTSFTVLQKNKEVFLTWNTATEVNNYGFEVQRSAAGSKSGSTGSWSKVGFVNGNGNSSSPKQYTFTDNSSVNNAPGTYSYRLKQIDNNGNYKYSSVVEVIVGSIPTVFSLEQNYPNPFNPSTTISYQLPANSFVTLKVYDVIGNEVKTLVNQNQNPGTYELTFNANNLASGVYFFQLKAGNYKAIKKMILMK